MSENLGDEFSKIMADAEVQERARAELESFLPEAHALILAELEQNSASYIWHPDDDQRSVNAARLYESLTTDAIPDTEEGEIKRIYAKYDVDLRNLSEITGISMLLMLLVRQDHDFKDGTLDLDFMSKSKKRLQAYLKVHGFDEGWVTTVDHLVQGQALDLSLEDDMQIYITEGNELLFREPLPLVTKLDEIFGSPSTVEEAYRVSDLSLEFFHTFLKLDTRPSSLPNAYELIESTSRDGRISDAQVQMLRDLVAELQAPTDE